MEAAGWLQGNSVATKLPSATLARLSQPSSWKRVAIISLSVVFLAAMYFLPFKEWSREASHFFEDRGFYGVVLFLLAYVVGTVFLVPGSALTLAAGLAFGSWGFVLADLGGTLGAVVTFWIGRHFAHERVARFAQTRPRFEALRQIVSREPWKIVILLRMSPIVPSSVTNYLLGVTDIKFSHYLFATALGLLPGSALCVYLGILGRTAASDETKFDVGSCAIGLVATLVLTVVLTRKANQALVQRGVR